MKPIFRSVLIIVTTLLVNSQSIAKVPNADWEQRVSSDSIKWSERMAISIMKIYPNAWQIDHHESPKWDYKIGMILTAYEKLYLTTNKSNYHTYIKEYADVLIDQNGAFQNFNAVDHNIHFINAGKILFGLYERTKEQKYLTALQTFKKTI